MPKPKAKAGKDDQRSPNRDKLGSPVETNGGVGTKAETKAKGKGKGRKGAAPVEELPILYPEIEIVKFLGDEALTAENAKEILGWEEEPAHLKWGDDYTVIDHYSRKVKCNNNSRNRHFTDSWARALCFDILNHNWADSRNGPGRTVNGETIVIGRHGHVLSAQHRLVGLVLAHQLWQLQPRWRDTWGEDNPPTMEAIVVYGVDESPATVRTLDNTRPRTQEDVFITEGQVFGRSRTDERQALCKILSGAIKWVWDRTGGKEDAFHPYRTHSEAVEFNNRHPRLARACKHIWEENRRKKDSEGRLPPPPVGRYVNPGVAAAFLYLMGASATDGDAYWGKSLEERSDNAADWSSWDRATQFWSDLAGDRLPEIAQAIAALSGKDGEYSVGPVEKRAVICKAWNLYKDEGPLEVEDIIPSTEISEVTGKRVVTEDITVGGIDQGQPQPKRRKEEDEGDNADEGEEEGEGSPAQDLSAGAGLEEKDPEPGDPTPEEIEGALQEAQRKREEKKDRRKEARKQNVKDRHAKIQAAKEKGKAKAPQEGYGL
jgi:hypothetical protein